MTHGVLDPNNDGYVSLPMNTGFTTSDVTQSEIPFRAMPLPFSEPVGDLATGASGSFTDLVTSSSDKTGFMAYYDGTNLVFRLRVGSTSSGAKAYSILLDADFKAGNSGSQPDPNYVAPTSQGSGNIGFEWEVLLTVGNATSVTVNETDGKTGPNIVQVFQTTNSDNWQIAAALSTNSNNADYFYDFYVPLSVFTGINAITSSTSFRMVATTVSSPTSALRGNRSDIYGVNDVNYPVTPDGWLTVVDATPPVTLSQLSTGSIAGVCTSPPLITSSSVAIGSGKSVSGTWTRGDVTMDTHADITLFRYSSSNALLNTYTSPNVASGSPWTITGITAASGDYFVAKAKGTSTTLNESECLQSNIIYGVCSSTLNPTILTQSSSKGICGSLTTGATAVLIYRMDATGNTLMNPSSSNTTYTATTFTWFACSGGQTKVSNGTYMVILSGNGCQSTPVYDCISNGSSSLSGLVVSTAITFPAAIYPFNNSISGSVPSFTGPQVATLFINNVEKATTAIPANTTTYTFSALQLHANDDIKIYLSGNGCTVYNTATVNCYNQPTVITTDANGILLAGTTSVGGTSAADANIRVNKTNTPTNSWTTTANGSGAWSVTVPTLVAGDTYTATVTAANGCTTASAASPVANVASVTTTCPTMNNTPYDDASTIVSGTVNVTTAGSIVRLYVDGALAGSQTLNTPGNQTWSITSSLPFYNGALLKATFQSGATGSEKFDCPTSAVICTSPAVPSIAPTSANINTGETVTYIVSNVASNAWYSVQDNTGKSYATSILTTTSNPFSLETYVFNSPNTYNLLVSANNLSGCAPSTATASVLVSNVVTPVRFISVNARKAQHGVVVDWNVADELEVNYYTIEKSLDGINFNVIGNVKYKKSTSATNKYSFTDPTASGADKLYYRVRQVANDQSYTFSPTVMVKLTIDKLLQIWPNPANNQVNLSITVSSAQTTHVELLDLNGKKILSKQVRVVPGSNYVVIKNLNTFLPGVYFFKVFADGRNHYQKLIIK